MRGPEAQCDVRSVGLLTAARAGHTDEGVTRITRKLRIVRRGVKAPRAGPGFFGNCRSGWLRAAH